MILSPKRVDDENAWKRWLWDGLRLTARDLLSWALSMMVLAIGMSLLVQIVQVFALYQLMEVIVAIILWAGGTIFAALHDDRPPCNGRLNVEHGRNVLYLTMMTCLAVFLFFSMLMILSVVGTGFKPHLLLDFPRLERIVEAGDNVLSLLLIIMGSTSKTLVPGLANHLDMDDAYSIVRLSESAMDKNKHNLTRLRWSAILVGIVLPYGGYLAPVFLCAWRLAVREIMDGDGTLERQSAHHVATASLSGAAAQ